MEPSYSPAVVEHFERPRNGGHFAAGEGVVQAAAGSIAQGTVFALSARIADDRIEAVRFEVYGCPHCIAAGSWLSERLVGLTRSELRAWRWRDADQELQFPKEKRGRLLILEDAVHALGEAWGRLIP
ncbi:iron-sulfur cluster assembly scaffold protein [Steroidobacter sp.]|uniref:iron-sulfur cluster assembly scaffold protein n=1 Tax=Steroidobacter sp. TaxID=1978227 RepID=UPI001A465DDE|nr:iron-sulfur cluster assembly scaffold protein [Steroidobacter sp.]MBL8270266.1 iron-sulfur cluster assembly scaffold protein [Steroidobacter sp.]